jgi:hypothetical protein
VANTHADGRDLVLAPAGPRDPDADPAGPALAPDIETGERADDPLLQVLHVAAQIGSAALQV